MTPPTAQDAVRFHDGLAEQWEDKYARATFARRAETLLAMAAPHELPGQHWLDAGCGTGVIARRLARQGCRVTAVDGSARMIEVARRAAALEQNSPPVRFQTVPDIAELPFADGTFDGVICSSVLEYVEAPARALAELARVTRPGAILIVSIPNRRALLRRLQKVAHWSTTHCGLKPWPAYMAHSRHDYTRQEFARLLLASAFSPRTCRYFGPGVPEALSDTCYAGTLLLAGCMRLEVCARESERVSL
jgi:ubiquinone/menaquinone biosynthesis C-methylase UbiE